MVVKQLYQELHRSSFLLSKKTSISYRYITKQQNLPPNQLLSSSPLCVPAHVVAGRALILPSNPLPTIRRLLWRAGARVKSFWIQRELLRVIWDDKAKLTFSVSRCSEIRAENPLFVLGLRWETTLPNWASVRSHATKSLKVLLGSSDTSSNRDVTPPHFPSESQRCLATQSAVRDTGVFPGWWEMCVLLVWVWNVYALSLFRILNPAFTLNP